MASKEITSYIVDLSPRMGRKGPGMQQTDLEFGLEYLYDSLMDKVLRGRKTDYVTVIACHSDVTTHPFSGERSFQNIEVLCNHKAPTYDDLEKLTRRLVPRASEVSEEEGDCFESMLVGVGMMKNTMGLKFIRNIVLITNGESAIKSFEGPVAEATKKAVLELDINVRLIGVNFGAGQDEPKPLFENDWRKALNEYEHSQVIAAKSAVERIKRNPPIRRIRPDKTFKGTLGFGRRGDSNSLDSTNEETDRIGFGVELYPAVKVEKPVSGNQYFVDEKTGSFDRIKSRTEYYINLKMDQEAEEGEGKLEGKQEEKTKVDENEEETEKEAEKMTIQKHECTKGFKYSNYDLLTIDEDLEKACKLPCDPGFDVIGFVKREKVPYAYLLGETQYVVPGSERGYGNLINFNSFCRSLIETDTYVITRLMQNPEEVKVCIMTPRIIKKGDSFMYCGVLIRLPFKEDEKIGRFPSLTQITTSSGKQYRSADYGFEEENQSQAFSESQEDVDADEEYQKGESKSQVQLDLSIFPDKRANFLMEQFIMSKNLDTEKESQIFQEGKREREEPVIENEKVTMTSSDRTEGLKERGNADPMAMLLASSPAIYKYTSNLKKFIFKAMHMKGNLDSFWKENNIVEKVVKDEMKKDPGYTNFFNLSNILNLNSSLSDELLKYNHRSVPVARELIEVLGVKHSSETEAASSSKRQKISEGLEKRANLRNTYGNYGAGEGEEIYLPKIEDLLG